jgi:(4-O-methyl)-D-glucuronate---lignin esterase
VRSRIAAGLCVVALATSPFVSAAAQEADPLSAGFRDPPNAARPRVWWHWISGNISLEGAKLDLAWLQRVGVGGVHTFSGGGLGEPHVIDPPVDFLSDRWQDVFRDTTQIARAAGMEVTIAGSPGWSETGGTWVAPDSGMKKYVWSETLIEGGRAFKGLLPQPPATTGPFMGVKPTRRGAGPKELTGDVYRDSVVVAFRTPPAEMSAGPAQYASSAGPLDWPSLQAGDLANAVELPIAEGTSSAWVQIAFARPTMLSALSLGLRKAADVEIQASDDGVSFHRLILAAADSSEVPAAQQTYAFPPSRATIFRLVLTAPPPKPPLPDLPAAYSRPQPPARSFAITRLAFTGGARVDRFESKAGFQSTVDAAAGATPTAAADALIRIRDVIDLTGKLRADGHLDWTPPPGHWTVLRFGWSLTGHTNGPAEPNDTGLEVDKLDASAVRAYLTHYLDLHQAAMHAKLGAATVQNLLTDSWEAGVQNWTPSLPAEFKARRGYDALPFLPVLAGRVVADSETSERFLWDFRRTLKEMLADNHYGVLAQVLHERGMSYYTEAQGDTPRAIGDGMTMKARSDIPTGEFWYRPFATAPGQPSLKADLDEAASAAHVYGKPLVACEALTVAAGTDPWAFSPAMLKPVADEIFAHGVNRILMHESHHQPLLDKAPGLEMAFFGQFFNRNDTWAEEAPAWVSYLSRTSYLLQQGQFVADVAYFYGEDRNLTELYHQRFNTDVPQGYAYDYINPEALLNLLAVQDGRLVTPSGMRYRVLYIPGYVTRLTLPVIRKIRDLVAAGAILVGNKPSGGLGVDSPDAAVLAVAYEIWGEKSGHVYANADLGAALAAERIAPDVAVRGAGPDDKFMSLHRRLADDDVYFISNRQNADERVAITFRVNDKAPEIWHAEDGRIEAASYELTDEGVRVPLHLDPNDALFVIFRRKANQPSWSAPQAVNPVLMPVVGPWAVRFQNGRGAPASASFDRLIDWTTSSDPGVKYFSGEAVYTKSITIPKQWIHPGRRITLDLGTVHELAVVAVDGKAVATSWHPPYRVDVTAALGPGVHRLEIKVVNLWVNRLVGDKQPGASAVAFAPQSPYGAASPLRPSGLIGPVQLLVDDIGRDIMGAHQ